MAGKRFLGIAALFVFIGASLFISAPGKAQDGELVIVKYGSLLVNSTESGARVYVDDIYKGAAGRVIDSIMIGEHTISVKTDQKSATGKFLIKKNETLKLDALLDDGRLVLHQTAKEIEPQVAKKQEPLKTDKPGKPQPKKTEPKKPEPKAEQKNPTEERRKAHLNVVKISYSTSNSKSVRVDSVVNQAVVSKHTVRKEDSGTYYRTKQGILLCDAGPCEKTWTISLLYTDETGAVDALLLKWKETVFNGITPAGTSREDLECCLNGQCRRMQYDSRSEESQEFEMGRYRLFWQPSQVIIRRSDIMQEILDAGQSLNDY